MKKRNFVVTALAALALTTLGIGALAGCNSGEKKPQPSSQESIVYCALTWKVAEHAKVTVEGYDDLPSQVEEDTAISFTVSVDEGYEVDSVKANNKKVSFKNEKYTVGITRDTEIVIEVSQAITDLKVQTNPTKLTYIAGEEIDLTGLVVVATLAEETSVKAKFENGQFSFEMPNEDVSLRITLSDIVEPVLNASYSGKTVVGETLTISASIDEVAISDFTVTAKVGANLVTVNGKQVTLNAVGTVTLEISATKDNFNLKKDLSFAISAGEASYGQNITYDDHAPTAGIESSTKTHRGTIITCGVDGGSISSLTYNKANNEYTMNYANGWAFYSVQLFFDLPYAEQGDTYHFAWDVNSDVAGQMTISGHAVDLQQGDNYVNFDVTQGSGALLSIQFGVNGGTNLEGSVLKFSPFRLYDADAAHKYHHVTFVNMGL